MNDVFEKDILDSLKGLRQNQSQRVMKARATWIFPLVLVCFSSVAAIAGFEFGVKTGNASAPMGTSEFSALVETLAQNMRVAPGRLEEQLLGSLEK